MLRIRHFIFAGVLTGTLWAEAAPAGAVEHEPNFWYLGSGVGYSAPFFFGLINDIYATVPAAAVLNLFGGYEAALTPRHRLAAEVDLLRTLPVTASEGNFTPTFSQNYPAGSTIWYRNVTQTVTVVYARYSFEMGRWWNLFARLGVGARFLDARIDLESPSGAVFEAASPSGVMAMLSAGFGIEIKTRDWGKISLSYQSLPPVVYRVAVGTTTVHASSVFLLQWRYALY